MTSVKVCPKLSDWLDYALLPKRVLIESILLTSVKAQKHGGGASFGHPLHSSELFLGARKRRGGKEKEEKRGKKRRKEGEEGVYDS